MVATTTNIHKETGVNNLITCCAPYFNPSSSSPPAFSVGGRFCLPCGAWEVDGPEGASVVLVEVAYKM